MTLVVLGTWLLGIAALPPGAEARQKTRKTKSPKTTDSRGKPVPVPKRVSKKSDKVGPLAVFTDIEDGWRR